MQFYVNGGHIRTRLVQHKIFIDCEGGLYWAILGYLALNLLLV